MALLARFSIASGYWAPPALLAVTALITLALVAAALVILPQKAARPQRNTDAPRPAVVLLVTFIASLFWHTLLALFWRIQPVFARWPLVLVPMLGAIAVIGMMVWLLRQWVATRDWNDRHWLALVSGALVSHSLFGGAVLTKSTVNRAGVAALILVTIALLSLFAIRVQDRALP